jgi:hypothetical protein
VLIRISPYDDPVQCQSCGHIAERRRLGQGPYRRRTLRGIRHLAPGDCEPDEYVTVCPDCGAAESFDEATKCAECGRFPCICTAVAAAPD